MILRRLGNKTKIANKIQQHFPVHKIYIEPFFGAGGMFFNKPKAKYNYLNDADADVYNLFNVISHRYKEFEDLLRVMPVCEQLWDHWKINKENDPIIKAVRFILLSNFGYMGKPNTLNIGSNNSHRIAVERLSITQEYIFGCMFSNCDFRKMITRYAFRKNERSQTLIYCDPPYLGTANNYSEGFTEQDSSDLFKCLVESKCMFAMSEFDHKFILEKAKEYNLNVIKIGERRNLNNRRMELLITNY